MASLFSLSLPLSLSLAFFLSIYLYRCDCVLVSLSLVVRPPRTGFWGVPARFGGLWARLGAWFRLISVLHNFRQSWPVGCKCRPADSADACSRVTPPDQAGTQPDTRAAVQTNNQQNDKVDRACCGSDWL